MTAEAPLVAPQNDHRFPCHTCGSDLRFDPASAQLVCDHCGNTEAIGGGLAWGSVIIRW